jgi:hypothetical protein
MERAVKLKDVVRDHGRERREERVGRERMVVRPDEGWRTSYARSESAAVREYELMTS